MQAREFHTLAARLTNGTRASEFRTAISRAYYAAYHTAFEVLTGMGFAPSTGHEAHKDVRDHLNNSGHPDVVRLAGKLGNLHGRRVDADYHLDRLAVEKQENARKIVEQADSVIYLLHEHCTGPSRRQIEAAIRTWIESR